jgi:NADPH-dependent 2,4-dienoyl-CoA reductase/sulfur reductase-like enzyme
MQHVIIGNGPAGVIGAETIRKHAPGDDILLIGDEPEPPYSRMAIPYLLQGQVSESGTYLRKTAGHFDRLRIRQLTARVSDLDCAARRLTLDDGTSIGFDKLLLATGSIPIRAPVPGIGRRPQLLDPGRCARNHGLGIAGRTRGADGGRIHRLHHPRSAGRARRASDRG